MSKEQIRLKNIPLTAIYREARVGIYLNMNKGMGTQREMVIKPLTTLSCIGL